VLLVDPHTDHPNNLAISGGLFPGAGSALQIQAGVSDSPDLWLADLRAFAGDSVNERIATSVAQALPEVVNFLTRELNAPIHFLPDVVSTGHHQCRFHSTLPASGAALHQCLRQQAQAHELIHLCPRPVTVVPVGTGFEGTDGTSRWRASHVMLAGGGFGAHPTWVAQHIPAMRGALYNGADHNDGSTIAFHVRFKAGGSEEEDIEPTDAAFNPNDDWTDDEKFDPNYVVLGDDQFDAGGFGGRSLVFLSHQRERSAHSLHHLGRTPTSGCGLPDAHQ
jgi:hypothetical protein